MADRIKLRRGPKSKIDLNVYELGYATDSTEKRLYFNDGSMVPIPNEKDINDIKNALGTASAQTIQNKQDIDELKEDVSGIIKTGMAKLVMYSYDVKLSEDTQKVNIPYERFDSTTDTLKVYINGIAIPNEYYTITNPVENDGIITNGYIVLTESRSADTIVRFEIWKNIPSGEEGGVSGSIIAENSIPSNRVIGLESQLNDIENNKQDKIEDSGWIELPLSSGIIAVSKPFYRKIGSEIFIKGSVKGVTNGNGWYGQQIATLPSGYRSKTNIQMIGKGDSVAYYMLSIEASGAVKVCAYSRGTSYVSSMDGTEFISLTSSFCI